MVIIGAGQAGFQTAASLRERGHTGEIHLIGDEDMPPYQRPPLSKQFLAVGARQPHEDEGMLLLRPRDFYTEQGIVVHQCHVVDIDRVTKTVGFTSGDRLGYDRLVLATGARNRPLPVPGTHLAGVHTLRTVADARELRLRLSYAEDVVVIGGGFCGLEFASAARAHGRRVTVVETRERLLARAVSPPISAVVCAHHVAQGIDILTGARVDELVDDNRRVDGVRTADGRTIKTDLVVTATGVVPNVELAEASGLAVADGILVDDRLRTSDRTIYAIGDCARFPTPDGPTRLESVQNAVGQAQYVAADLTGNPQSYRDAPWFWSRQGALNIQIAGLTTTADTHVPRGDAANRTLAVFCFRAGEFVGVEAVNRPADYLAGRHLLANGVPLSPDQAADPTFDLRSHATRTPG